MNNKTIKNLTSVFFCLLLTLGLHAQVLESCECAVDTLGYSNFIQTLNPNENANFQFHVNGTFAVAYGVIGSTTPSLVQDLIDNYPAVTTIVMYSCPGSEDDVSNLQASQLIHNAGYKMYLPMDGWVASGATDMFLAGSTRVVEITPDPVGVHSWSDGANEATDYPVGHSVHQLYIDYYVDIGFSLTEAEDFYYFTINAAPANGIYWMSDAEIDQYKIRTCKYSDSPNYSVTIDESTLIADLAGASYQWIDCADNSIIGGAINQSFTPSQSGSYAVQITETECMNTSSCYSITTTGIVENNFKNRLKVYPNPTDGDLSIDLGNKYESGTIKLLDINGQFLESATYNERQLLNLRIEKPAGVYSLIIESGDKKTLIRIVKK